MENQKYPIGIQSFAKLREEGYLYIDKTKAIYDLVKEKSYIFISRPRRFGKSLLLNTLKSFFEGRKELFEGLYIADKMPFDVYPIIHLSFDKLNYTTWGLKEVIMKELKKIAQSYEFVLEEEGMQEIFIELCEKLHKKYGKKVVILIDEYDNPILHYLEKQDHEKAEEIREDIRTFYSVIKSLDEHTRFFFVTGISRFAKVSLFSVVNNLEDITFHKQFATICGYSQAELESYFPEKIGEIAAENDISYESCLEKIKVMYNGYSWDGVQKVYAPFSTLKFMSEKTFRSHWFTTGTPSFLLKLLTPKFQYDLEDIWVSDTRFDNFEMNRIDAISLMFQTGYLTIKAAKERSFQVHFPNQEVKDAFLQFLGGEYTHQGHGEMFSWVYHFTNTLNEGKIEEIEEAIDSLFCDIPYQLFKGNQENFYHAIMFISLKLIGVHIKCEVSHRKGRLDAVIETEQFVYIFEFKINATAEIALQQAKDKQYHQPYLASGKKIFICGVNFSNEKRGVEDWKYEEILNH